MSKGKTPSAKLWLTVVCFLTCVLFVAPAYAQYAETTGNIQGTVKDPSGAVIPGASVELSSPAMVAPQKTTSDGAGYFRFANLPPGEYAVLVSGTGFKQEKRTLIRLEVGRTLTFEFKLQIGAVAEIIEVQSAPLNIDVTSNKASVNITADQIQFLPKGRNAFTMIDLAPGARFEPLQGAVRTAATTRGVDLSYQIDGASDGENVYALEGMDTSNVRQGGIGVSIPTDFVREIQIKSSGFEAEYGGALGGVVNIVLNRGSNTWHGGGVFYLRASEVDAHPRQSIRLDPTISPVTSTRLSNPVQYYQPKKDNYKTFEPGFDVGGPIWTDKLWIYGSYIPSFYRQTRTVNFACTTNCLRPFTGPRSFPTNDTIHFALGRLDSQILPSVRANFGWHYAYRRRTGTAIPSADSVFSNQANQDRLNDPGSFRPDFGDVNPNSTYTTSADWTITPKWIVTGRYGYWFSNTEHRGRPTGTRFIYQTATPATGLGGAVIPGSAQGSAGTQNMPSNFQTLFDAFKRHGLNIDSSYSFRGWGSHTFKGGYALNRLSEDVQETFNTAQVLVFWGRNYDAPITAAGQSFCAANKASNLATFGQNVCQGQFGFYTVNDGIETFGAVASYNRSIYIQDTWQVAKGVTLNLGIRFDKEYLPSYAPLGSGAYRSTPISFGFGDKVAPRIGGAWDVFGTGKVKVYASWGLFYDIMKYEMPRGSFGGEYWHDCIFTLTTTDISTITPLLDSGNHSCPGNGGTPGQKIEEIDWRAVSADDLRTLIPKDIKPMRQRELVIGGEYSLSRHIGLEVRYARKRLDRTIEDVGFFGALGETYFIGNPGESILRNPVADVCPTCPTQPKATRNYDGIEFKVRKTWSRNWFLEGSYTYSRLFGNYSGLTSTDEEGRHSPNVNRFFDLPHMTFDSHGQPVFGLLNTDRPHTLKMYGAYRLKWWGMETTLGFLQLAYSGTPISTEMGVVGSLSSSSFVEGRSTFVDISRNPSVASCGQSGGIAAAGCWISNGLRNDLRTEAFTQTEFLFVHDFRLSKSNEALKATFEMNVSNLLNQNHDLNVIRQPARTGVLTFPVAGSAVPNWLDVFDGFDYIAKANFQGLLLNPQYGMASRFQSPRSVRLKLKVTF